MTLLIVFSSILAYIFIGLFVMFVWCEYRYRHCDEKHDSYSRCDHEAPAILMGIFWPLGPIFYLLSIALWHSAMKLAEWVMGDEPVQDK